MRKGCLFSSLLIFWVAFWAAFLLQVPSADAIAKIVTYGSKFFYEDGKQFYIKGTDAIAGVFAISLPIDC